MLGRRTVGVIVVAFSATTMALLIGSVAAAGAESGSSSPPTKATGPAVAPGRNHVHEPPEHVREKLDAGEDTVGADAGSPADRPRRAPDASPGQLGGSPNPSPGSASGGPTVGGAPATTTGAAGNEAAAVSTAPTPPNGAEPAAAGSPGAVGSPAETPASPEPAPAADTDFSDLSGAIGATDPLPAATGLSPDTTRPGLLVAVLAFAVLLFLVAHQFVDGRDPRLGATRDAEAVARFR
jgi:pilus assembly protein FimV